MGGEIPSTLLHHVVSDCFQLRILYRNQSRHILMDEISEYSCDFWYDRLDMFKLKEHLTDVKISA